jgi:hypothetical protein
MDVEFGVYQQLKKSTVCVEYKLVLKLGVLIAIARITKYVQLKRRL